MNISPAEQIEPNVIKAAEAELTASGIRKTNESKLILACYSYYLEEPEKANAYVDWRQDSNPPIDNPTVFLPLMDRDIIGRIGRNFLTDVLQGLDLVKQF